MTGFKPRPTPHANITIGKGHVIWAKETTDSNNNFFPKGWVLPGGKRTNSRDLAETVAYNINRLSN